MPELSLTTLLMALFALILCSAFFSCSETAMMAVNRYRLRHLAKHGHASARRAEKLLQRPDELLSTILIGNTLANILASSIATILAMRYWGEVGIAIATFALTLLVLIFGETTPKTIAAMHANRIALIVAWPLGLLRMVFYPFVWLVNIVSQAIINILQIERPHSMTDHLSSDELRTVVAEASGHIPPRHKRMLLRILDLKEMSVDDIMVPRTDIFGIDLEEEWSDILVLLRNTQHTKMPLYENSIENMIGVIHVRDIINLLGISEPRDEDGSKAMLREVAKEVYYVPQGTALTTQLLNFQNKRERIAMVVDEYGEIQGLVTLEDILEEIVGEFTTDVASDIDEVHAQPDGSFLVEGTANVRELNRYMHWDLPTDGPKTLNGLVIEYLEFMPRQGMCLKIKGYAMEIVAMHEQKIKSIRMNPPPKPHK